MLGIRRVMRKRGGFVRPARSAVGRDQAAVQRVGNAIIGGDPGGNPRGTGAIDVQLSRTVETQVASGDNAVAYGVECKASGMASVALGYQATAEQSGAVAVGSAAQATVGSAAVAIGRSCQASAASALAVGDCATASGIGAIAIGAGAEARPAQTFNLAGLGVIKRGAVASPDWAVLSGLQIVVMSEVVDLKSVADHQFTLPAGTRLYWDACGVICTSAVGVTAQPSVRFGFAVAGKLGYQKTGVACTGLTGVGKRNDYTNHLHPEEAGTSINAGVTVAATGTTLLGRFYVRGILVEDEV